jgi:hypothetical protein
MANHSSSSSSSSSSSNFPTSNTPVQYSNPNFSDLDHTKNNLNSSSTKPSYSAAYNYSNQVTVGPNFDVASSYNQTSTSSSDNLMYQNQFYAQNNSYLNSFYRFNNILSNTQSATPNDSYSIGGAINSYPYMTQSENSNIYGNYGCSGSFAANSAQNHLSSDYVYNNPSSIQDGNSIALGSSTATTYLTLNTQQVNSS